jgi:hypothetical protein
MPGRADFLRGFELMAIGRCRSYDPNRWRNTAHSRQTPPSTSPFTPKPIRAANLAPKARRFDPSGNHPWLASVVDAHRARLGQSASVVRRSLSFALHGHEPFHVVAPTPAARFTDDRERWTANVGWCCRRRTAECLADVRVCRFRIDVDQGAGGHDHPIEAIAALSRAAGDEGRLHRVKPPVRAKPFEGHHRSAGYIAQGQDPRAPAVRRSGRCMSRIRRGRSRFSARWENSRCVERKKGRRPRQERFDGRTIHRQKQWGLMQLGMRRSVRLTREIPHFR